MKFHSVSDSFYRNVCPSVTYNAADNLTGCPFKDQADEFMNQIRYICKEEVHLNKSSFPTQRKIE